MSGELPAEHRDSSPRESFRQSGLLRRLRTLWSFGSREEEDAHPVTADLAEGEAAENQSPGLQWADLEALFGQNVQALGLETAEAANDDDSPPAMKWSEDNIRKLVDAFGVRVLNDANGNEITLVHLTLMGRQLKCAALLFDYAAERQFHVTLCWRDGDILGWSLDNKSRRLTEFVLQRMSEQCSAPEETAGCLRDHFQQLVKQFPQVMQNYITSDKFCFEFGRFDVPQSLFADRADAPIAVLDAAPSSWRPTEGSSEVKNFWERKGLGGLLNQDSTSDAKVSAVSKFLCIDLSKVQDQQMVVKSLLSANYPVDMFKTQSIKNFVQWRWILKVRGDAVITLLFDLLATALLFLFIAIAWDIGGDYLSPLWYFARSVLIAAFGAKCLPIASGRVDGILQAGLMFYLLLDYGGGLCILESYRFATSLQCVLCLVVLMEDLKPFNLTGPFISMIGYVLLDIRPFIVLGSLMIFTFGAAFRVLFADLVYDEHGVNCADERDGQSFQTLSLSFESMFHAALGQFEPEALHATRTSFFATWRSLLFDLFLFLVAIVLLSLLIAVLGDTCDRVILTREAESIKSRATCLTRKSLKERSQDRGVRKGTKVQERIARVFFAVVYNVARVFYQLLLWLYLVFFLAAFLGAVFQSRHSLRLAVAPLVLLFGVAAPLILKRGFFLERLIVRDPFLLNLNTHQADAKVLVFWFLIPVAAVNPKAGVFWEGRLLAMSRLVSDRLMRTEQNQERDMAKLESRISNIEATLHRQTQNSQEMQDRLIRMERMLEQMTDSAPQSRE